MSTRTGKNMVLTTNSVAETHKLGLAIGHGLTESLMISLSGDLGAGKTHLAKGIAEGMGVTEDVTSPTFAIVQEYMALDNQPSQKLDLYHFDLYRIMNEEELYYIGYDDYLKKSGVIILEWAENAKSSLVDDRLDISLAYTSLENQRTISLLANGEKAEKLLKMVEMELAGGSDEDTGN